MQEFLRKAIRGEVGAYVQALVVALLVAAMVYAVVFGTGCYEPVGPPPSHTSWESQQGTGQRNDFRVRLQANARHARPGERATRTLGGQGDPGTTQVSYRWTPPWGATNFSYNPAPDDAGPPAIWLDLPPDQEIQISYDQPSLPPGESTMLATDTALAEWAGHSSATSYTTLITNEPALLAPLPATPPMRDSLVPEDIAELWEIRQWTDLPGITMTTDLCQDWFELLQSDDIFLAMRAPVSPTATLTEGYPLPIVFGDPYSNTLELFSYDAFAPVVTVPVELRPERFTFLENALPSAPGEHWMALGLVSETVTCPSSDLDADRWSFRAQGYLDLTHEPNNCEGCVQPFYYCYEGQEAPPLAAVYNALGGEGVTSYQGWGITCIGPYAASLLHETGWQFGGASSIWVTPTQTITLYHDIHVKATSDPMTFTLDYTSPLGVEWHLYDDAGFEPDLSNPITPPISVTPGDWRFFWMVSDPVPTGTLSGAHSLVITATSVLTPADSLWASDLIWVGGWVAPPAPPGYGFQIYLPLVVK